jgi:iron complex transport system permease protein
MKRIGGAPSLALGVVVLAAAAAYALSRGAIPVSGGDLLAVLAGREGPTPWQRTLILDVRLPRVVAGLLVGGGLAVSGATLQGLFRNPLADPGVIGVSSGASLGAVLAMYLGLAAVSSWSVPAGSIAFAAAAAFVVYASASRRGRTPVGSLLLAGIAVGSFASALTSFVLSVALDEYEQGRQTFRWLMGGLEARNWHEVALVGPPTLVGAAIMLASVRELDALVLGEVEASAVGVDVHRVRRRLVLATSLVVGSAVAVSGVIGFVGLVIPHVLRLLVGPVHAVLLPASLIYGAAFLVTADALARTLLAPEEIRLGVVTALIGAPFFLFLLLRRREEYAVE